MPIYSYKCIKCGEVFDKLVNQGTNGTASCIHCQSDARRVFSPVGIIFKGSGFYTTDYKSGSSSAGNPGKDRGSEKSSEKSRKEPSTTAGDKSKEKKESGK